MKKKITEFIHKETNRTDLQETSLPLYLTSGYVYKSAQEAEDVFNEKKNLQSLKELSHVKHFPLECQQCLHH